MVALPIFGKKNRRIEAHEARPEHIKELREEIRGALHRADALSIPQFPLEGQIEAAYVELKIIEECLEAAKVAIRDIRRNLE